MISKIFIILNEVFKIFIFFHFLQLHFKIFVLKFSKILKFRLQNFSNFFSIRVFQNF